MDKINVAVIGCGHLGSFHAQKYSELEDANLVAVCDIIEDKAKFLSNKLKCKSYIDYRDLLSNEKGINCVSVVTDTSSHSEICSFFLNSGIDVLVEKPMALDFKESEKIYLISKKQNRILQIGHIERFNPVVIKLKQVLEKTLYIEAKRVSTFKDRGLDVDVVSDLMLHDLDLVLNLINKPIKKIDAIGLPVATDLVDVANVRIEFEGGEVANISASRVSKSSERSFRVFDNNRYFSLNLSSKSFKTVVKDNSSYDFKETILEYPEVDMLKEEISSFLKSVKNRTKPIVSGEDGVRVMYLIEEIKEKIKISSKKLDSSSNEIIKALAA